MFVFVWIIVTCFRSAQYIEWSVGAVVSFKKKKKINFNQEPAFNFVFVISSYYTLPCALECICLLDVSISKKFYLNKTKDNSKKNKMTYKRLNEWK